MATPDQPDGAPDGDPDATPDEGGSLPDGPGDDEGTIEQPSADGDHDGVGTP